MKTQLLVRNLKNKLEIIHIEEGGGYFDISKVLWDERSGEPFPEHLRSECDADKLSIESELLQREVNIAARSLLQGTDWKIIKEIEKLITNPELQQLILDRQAARDAVK